MASTVFSCVHEPSLRLAQWNLSNALASIIPRVVPSPHLVPPSPPDVLLTPVLQATHAWCAAKSGSQLARSAFAPSVLILGRTLQDLEDAKGSLGLRSTHGLSCKGWDAAACLAK